MKRREFGQRMLELGAALGLRSMGPGVFASLIGCGDPVAGDDAHAEATDDAIAHATTNPTSTTTGTQTAQPAQAQGRDKSVVVIGSGYGSAVTAMRFTERGIPVTMYEMGRLWNQPGKDGKVFASLSGIDGRAMWFKDKFEGVIKQIKIAGVPVSLDFATPVQAGILHVSGPENMRVYRGRGVGGGSLVNMAVLVTPERGVLQKTFPDVDVDSLLDVYYPRARRQLRASRVPEDLVREEMYRYSRVGEANADAAGYQNVRLESGYDYDYMRLEVKNEVPKSAVGGEAGFGNNYGKNSLDKTYIADAMGSGLLTIHAMTEVQRVRPDPSGGFILDVVERDLDGKLLSQREVSCSHLFVGAGSVDTSALMVRARERGDLPDLNSAVGTAWGPNSDIFVALNMPLTSPTGATQCTIPSSAFRTHDPDGRRALTMVIPFPMGFESFVSFNIVMTESPEAGHFTYDRSRDEAVLNWAPEQSALAVATARRIFDPINQKTGAKYNESLFGGPVIGDRSTYHPVGGMPLGRATDAFGRVREYPGLYVVDGSLISVGLAANPALTVAALAERNVERILKEDFDA